MKARVSRRVSKKESRATVARKSAVPRGAGSKASRVEPSRVGPVPDHAPTPGTNDAVSHGPENPLLGVLLALGAGFGLGWLASLRREREPQ